MLERGEGVGEGLAVGVVEVDGEGAGSDARRVQGAQQGADLAGVATPMVSPSESSSQPMACRAVATCTTWASGTGPSHGSPKHIER